MRQTSFIVFLYFLSQIIGIRSDDLPLILDFTAQFDNCTLIVNWSTTLKKCNYFQLTIQQTNINEKFYVENDNNYNYKYRFKNISELKHMLDYHVGIKACNEICGQEFTVMVMVPPNKPICLPHVQNESVIIGIDPETEWNTTLYFYQLNKTETYNIESLERMCDEEKPSVRTIRAKRELIKFDLDPDEMIVLCSKNVYYNLTVRGDPHVIQVNSRNFTSVFQPVTILLLIISIFILSVLNNMT